MLESVFTLAIFALLFGASLVGLFAHSRFPAQYRSEETASVVRSVVSLFIMTTSLVLGLMLNSARTTFEATDHNLHVLATDLILLDRALEQYGSDAVETRARLRAYTERAATGHTDPSVADRISESLLSAIGTGLAAIRPTDAAHANLLRDMTVQYQTVVQVRWTILEQSDGTIPIPLIAIMVAWLILIFASFGYRAPVNAVVIGTLAISSALMAFSFYLVLTLDRPFDGLIQVSSTPLGRALAEMQD